MVKKKSKKKKTIGEQVNPLFIECLEKLSAQAKNQKYDAYKKALKSLHVYPLKLRSGKEAMQLQGIGPKIAEKIDAYLKEKGYIPPADEETNLEDSDIDEIKKTKKTKKTKTTKNTSKKKKSSCRKYIPKFKSAPWAILIALYRASKTQSLDALTKTELIKLSAPLTDTPMTPQFSAGRVVSFYCGWNSVNGTLIPKNLIVKQGRPQKFSLTKKGRRIARLLHVGALELMEEEATFDVTDSEGEESETEEPAEENNSDSEIEMLSVSDKEPLSQNIEPSLSQQSSFNEPQSISKISSQDIIEISDDEPESPKIDIETLSDDDKNEQSIHESKRMCDIEINYMSYSDAPTNRKDEAKVHIDGETGLCFCVKVVVPKSIVPVASKLMKIEQSKDASNDLVELIGWLLDHEAKDTIDELKQTHFKDLFKKYNSIMNNQISTNTKTIRNTKQKTTKRKKDEEKPKKRKKDDQETIEKPKKKRKIQVLEDDESDISTLHSNDDIEIYSQNDEITNSTRIDFKDFLKQPAKPQQKTKKFVGEYDVILIIDARERTHGDRSYIYDQLLKKGINCEKRNLNLGDMLWIARRKGRQDEEVVLDFIVERKIMDDLASSIIDGRYKEQKYRLKHCGIKNIYYLVEGDIKHQNRLPIQNIETALVNIQSSDHFFLQRTSNVQSSIDYLVMLTKEIEEMIEYEGIDTLSFIDPIENTTMNVNQFNQQVGKNKNLTNTEIFGRQLSLIKGCSSKIASTIISKYPLPRTLIEAYDQCEDEEEKANMLKGMEITEKFGGITKRKIGKVLSNFIYQLYCSEKYP